MSAVINKKSWEPLFLRLVSVLTLTAFLVTSLSSGSAFAGMPSLDGTKDLTNSFAGKQLPLSLSSVTVPEKMGKIENRYEGDSSKIVILIQDAHAIQDAQRNIHQLINYFRSRYGIDTVAAEGSSSEMDPQIFRSFPDQELLKKAFEKYFEDGELNGTVAAAIFPPQDKSASGHHVARFTGIEDWKLYEEGVAAYLQAMEQQPGISAKLKVKSEKLKREKEKIYSPRLLKIDQLLESFNANGANLEEVLLKLSEVKLPEPGSDLAVILEEQENGMGHGAATLDEVAGKESVSLRPNLDQEFNRVAWQVRRQLELKGKNGRSQLGTFNTQYQSYQTSQLAPQSFALFLKELISKEKLAVEMPDTLGQKAAQQKRMRDIEGTKFFRDFERYVRSVKGSLFRNEEERKLDRQARCLELLERLARLELGREEWETINLDNVDRITHNVNQTLRAAFELHLVFYRNAVERENSLFENLMGLFQSKGNDPAGRQFSVRNTVYDIRNTILAVVGGFHSQGMTRLLKEKGISYILVRPQINILPENSHYREQMKGEVSWKNYFRVENGKVNLYEAFVRAARDRLLTVENEKLKTKNEGDADASLDIAKRYQNSSLFIFNSSLLKLWRDQLLFDLAKAKRIEKAGNYTRFIDEVVPVQTADNIHPSWMAKVERFIESLRGLDSAGKVTEQNVLKLLQPSAIPTQPSANALSPRAASRALAQVLTRPRGTLSGERPASVRQAKSEVLADERSMTDERNEGVAASGPSDKRARDEMRAVDFRMPEWGWGIAVIGAILLTALSVLNVGLKGYRLYGAHVAVVQTPEGRRASDLGGIPFLTSSDSVYRHLENARDHLIVQEKTHEEADDKNQGDGNGPQDSDDEDTDSTATKTVHDYFYVRTGPARESLAAAAEKAGAMRPWQAEAEAVEGEAEGKPVSLSPNVERIHDEALTIRETLPAEGWVKTDSSFALFDDGDRYKSERMRVEDLMSLAQKESRSYYEKVPAALRESFENARYYFIKALVLLGISATAIFFFLKNGHFDEFLDRLPLDRFVRLDHLRQSVQGRRHFRPKADRRGEMRSQLRPAEARAEAREKLRTVLAETFPDLEKKIGREVSDQQLDQLLEAQVIDPGALNKIFFASRQGRKKEKVAKFTDTEAEKIARAVRQAKKTESPWALHQWKKEILLGLSAFIVALVFIPWVQHFIQGQFFAKDIIGTDFYRYTMGARALFEHGVDPYSDPSMHQLIQGLPLQTDHPNPAYDRLMLKDSFSVEAGPIAKGVVSPPLVLVLLYPLVRLLGYAVALNFWTIFSFIGFSWVTLLFWKKIGPTEKPGSQLLERLGARAAVVSLLVFASTAVLQAGTFGQFDLLYFVPMALAVYLWIYHRDRPATIALTALLVAFAGAVKIFPLALFGYFALKTYQAWKTIPPAQRWRWRVFRELWTNSPEFRVLIYGLGFFIGLNIVTMIFTGPGVFASFFMKLGNLSVEASHAATKGNLLSYLKFLPIWLSGAFSPMTGSLAWMFLPVVAVSLWFWVRPLSRGEPANTSVDPEHRKMTGLLEVSLLLALLPTVMPHWWAYYNVIMLIPLMVIFTKALAIGNPGVRRKLYGLLAASFALSFFYVTMTAMLSWFPALGNIINNNAALEAARDEAARHPEVARQLIYGSLKGEILSLRPEELAGRVPSFANFFLGYPGTLLLAWAGRLALREHQKESDTISGRRHEMREVSRGTVLGRIDRRQAVKMVCGLGTSVLASWLGAHAVLWEGRRQMANTAEFKFLDDQLLISPAAAGREVEQMVRDLRVSARNKRHPDVAGLVYDLIPPSGFIRFLQKSNPALAAAVMTDDPGVFRSSQSIFEYYDQYQSARNTEYQDWFQNWAQPVPALRYAGQPGGILTAVERHCLREKIPVAQLNQRWIEWSLYFNVEYFWQRAFEEFKEKDFGVLSGWMQSHHQNLRELTELRQTQTQSLRVNPAGVFSYREGLGGIFVFIQQPSVTALESFTQFKKDFAAIPSERPSSEDEVAAIQNKLLPAAVNYILEELLRRARQAKTGNSEDAFLFARTKIKQLAAREMEEGWGSWHIRMLGRHGEGKSIGPEEILGSLSQDGLFQMNEVSAENVLLFDSPLPPLYAERERSVQTRQEMRNVDRNEVQRILHQMEVKQQEWLEMAWLQPRLLQAAGILTRETRVFNFLTGIDLLPGLYVDEMWTVDYRTNSEMTREAFFKFMWPAMRTDGPAPGFKAWPQDLFLGKIHSTGRDVLEKGFLEDWAKQMRAGDVVWLRFADHFIDHWLTEKLKRTADGQRREEHVLAMKEWMDRLISLVPEGCLIVLFECLDMPEFYRNVTGEDIQFFSGYLMRSGAFEEELTRRLGEDVAQWNRIQPQTLTRKILIPAPTPSETPVSYPVGGRMIVLRRTSSTPKFIGVKVNDNTSRRVEMRDGGIQRQIDSRGPNAIRTKDEEDELFIKWKLTLEQAAFLDGIPLVELVRRSKLIKHLFSVSNQDPYLYFNLREHPQLLRLDTTELQTIERRLKPGGFEKAMKAALRRSDLPVPDQLGTRRQDALDLQPWLLEAKELAMHEPVTDERYLRDDNEQVRMQFMDWFVRHKGPRPTLPLAANVWFSKQKKSGYCTLFEDKTGRAVKLPIDPQAWHTHKGGLLERQLWFYAGEDPVNHERYITVHSRPEGPALGRAVWDPKTKIFGHYEGPILLQRYGPRSRWWMLAWLHSPKLAIEKTLRFVAKGKKRVWREIALLPPYSGISHGTARINSASFKKGEEIKVTTIPVPGERRVQIQIPSSPTALTYFLHEHQALSPSDELMRRFESDWSEWSPRPLMVEIPASGLLTLSKQDKTKPLTIDLEESLHLAGTRNVFVVFGRQQVGRTIRKKVQVYVTSSNGEPDKRSVKLLWCGFADPKKTKAEVEPGFQPKRLVGRERYEIDRLMFSLGYSSHLESPEMPDGEIESRILEALAGKPLTPEELVLKMESHEVSSDRILAVFGKMQTQNGTAFPKVLPVGSGRYGAAEEITFNSLNTYEAEPRKLLLTIGEQLGGRTAAAVFENDQPLTVLFQGKEPIFMRQNWDVTGQRLLWANTRYAKWNSDTRSDTDRGSFIFSNYVTPESGRVVIRTRKGKYYIYAEPGQVVAGIVKNHEVVRVDIFKPGTVLHQVYDTEALSRGTFALDTQLPSYKALVATLEGEALNELTFEAAGKAPKGRKEMRQDRDGPLYSYRKKQLWLPPNFDRDKPVELSVVIADIDHTLLALEAKLEGENGDELIRALLNDKKVILISGSPYKRWYLGKDYTNLSIQRRVIEIIRARLKATPASAKVKNPIEKMQNLEVLYVSGKGKVTFGPDGRQLSKTELTEKEMSPELELSLARGFAGGLISVLSGISSDQFWKSKHKRVIWQMQSPADIVRYLLDPAGYGLNQSGFRLDFFTLGTELSLTWWSDQSVHGNPVLKYAQDILRRQGIDVLSHLPFPSAGHGFAKFAAIRKRDIILAELKRLQLKGMVLALGDSWSTDDFLDLREDELPEGMLYVPVYLGRVKDTRNHPYVFVAHSQTGLTNVRETGFARPLRNVQDAEDEGLPLGDLRLVDGGWFSPNQLQQQGIKIYVSGRTEMRSKAEGTASEGRSEMRREGPQREVIDQTAGRQAEDRERLDDWIRQYQGFDSARMMALLNVVAAPGELNLISLQPFLTDVQEHPQVKAFLGRGRPAALVLVDSVKLTEEVQADINRRVRDLGLKLLVDRSEGPTADRLALYYDISQVRSVVQSEIFRPTDRVLQQVRRFLKKKFNIGTQDSLTNEKIEEIMGFVLSQAKTPHKFDTILAGTVLGYGRQHAIYYARTDFSSPRSILNARDIVNLLRGIYPGIIPPADLFAEYVIDPDFKGTAIQNILKYFRGLETFYEAQVNAIASAKPSERGKEQTDLDAVFLKMIDAVRAVSALLTANLRSDWYHNKKVPAHRDWVKKSKEILEYLDSVPALNEQRQWSREYFVRILNRLSAAAEDITLGTDDRKGSAAEFYEQLEAFQKLVEDRLLSDARSYMTAEGLLDTAKMGVPPSRYRPADRVRPEIERQVREAGAIRQQLNLAAAGSLRTVFYFAIGYDFARVFDALDADVVVGVDPYRLREPSDPVEKRAFNEEVKRNICRHIEAWGGKINDVREIGLWGSGGKVIFNFERNRQEKSLVIYREEAKDFPADRLDETREGFDGIYFDGTSPEDFLTVLEKSASRLRPKGFVLERVPTERIGKSTGKVWRTAGLKRLKTFKIENGTYRFWQRPETRRLSLQEVQEFLGVEEFDFSDRAIGDIVTVDPNRSRIFFRGNKDLASDMYSLVADETRVKMGDSGLVPFPSGLYSDTARRVFRGRSGTPLIESQRMMARYLRSTRVHGSLEELINRSTDASWMNDRGDVFVTMSSLYSESLKWAMARPGSGVMYILDVPAAQLLINPKYRHGGQERPYGERIKLKPHYVPLDWIRWIVTENREEFSRATRVSTLTDKLRFAERLNEASMLQTFHELDLPESDWNPVLRRAETRATEREMIQPVGARTEMRADGTAALKELHALVLDDLEPPRKFLRGELQKLEMVKSVQVAEGSRQAFDIMSEHPEINFMVVDFKLSDVDATDNGVAFIKRIYERRGGYDGKIVILTADVETVQAELFNYPELKQKWIDGKITWRLKAMDLSEGGEIQKIAEAYARGQADTDEAMRERKLPPLTLRIPPEMIGPREEVLARFKNRHFIIADDARRSRDCLKAALTELSDDEHIRDVATVEEVVKRIEELRAMGIRDDQIVVLSDYEFGTEQGNVRRKDGHDLLHMLRLHPDAADYEGPKLDFKGFFFWVSGSIISRDQITGYDADAKDIEEWIKTEYGVDYIQKEPDENFSVDMLRMIDQRFQQPYPLPERITKTIKRKPVLKPADVSFLNGAVNDFEMNLGRWLDSLESELPRVMGLGPDKDSLGAIRRNIRELRWLIDFNHTRKVDELGRDLLDFNGRLHDYNGNVAMSGGFIVRDLRDQIRTLEISDDVRIALNEKLDGLSLMLKMTSDYLVRLLRLSKVVGNIGRGITFEEFRHSTVGPFLKNYGRFIELEEQYDPAALAGMKLPFGLCNIVSHVLNNALQQYLLVKKEKFKGKIRMDVQTTREGQKFSISIEDEAGGIPEAVLPHIFDRLFTTKAHGAGFGLYWAKRLLQLYGGEISAANQGEGEHKGAVFAIAIPFDWPEHARKMSAVTEELVGRIREILQAKKHPRAEDLAPLVAGEISELANSIAHYTQSMEFDAADDLGRYGSPPYINEARRKDSIDFSKMVFEMGVTEAEITEVLLAILAADRPGGLSAEMAKRLPPETVIVTGEGSGPETAEDRYLNLQVRSAANIALSAEGLTAERRHQYQQAVRQIKYAIHKLINSCGIVWMRWRDIEEREGLPQAEIEHLQKIFKARLPERQLQLVQRYTYSTGSYTGFEDDPLVVERFPGWAGVIQGLTEALAAVNEEGRRKLRNYFQSRPLEEIETVKIWLHYMEYLIESAQTLASMSRGEVAQNRYWVDLENFPNNAEPLSKLLDRIHVEIQPGTRIWLNRFILGNIALNVYRMKDDRSMDITVDEADGSTRIRFRYKGNVNLQRVTETIGNDHPLYYVQFLLDLVETAGASVSAANDGEYAEITVLFPIPSSVTQTTTEITPLNNALSTARSEAPVGRDSAIVAPSASAVSVAAGERRTEMRSDLTQANLPEFARQAEDGQYTAFQATVLGRGESTLRIKCGEILGIVPREEVESGYSSFVSGRQISAVLLGSSQGAAIFSLFPTESLTARFNFLADLQHDLQQPLTARAINMRVLPDSFVIWNGRVSGMAVNYVEENQEGAAGFRIPGFIPYSAISYRFDETDRESLLHQPEVLDRLVADLRRRPFWAKLTNIDKKMGLQRLGLSRKAMEFSSLEEARGLYEILNFDVKALAFEPGSQAPVGLEGVLQSDLKPELNGLKAVLFVNSLEPSLRPQFRNDPAAFVSGAGTLAVRVNRVDLPHGQLSIQVTQKHMDPSNNIPMALRALRRAMVSRPQTPISVVVTTDTSSGQPFVPVQFNRVPGKLTVPEGHGQSLYTRSQTLRVYVSKVSTNSFEATLMPQSFMESDHRVETRNAKFIPAFVKVEGNYQRVRLDDGSMLSFYQAPLHSPSEKGGQMLRGFLDAITQSQLPPGDYVLYGDRQGPLLLTKMAVIPHDEIATSLQNPVIGQMLQQAGIQGDDFNLVRLLEIVPVIKTPPERAQTALDLWMKGIPALYGMDKTSPLVTVMGMSMKRPPCLTGLEIFQFPGNADFDHEVRLFYDLNVDGASEEDVAVFETEQRPNVRVVMFGKNRLYDRYEDYLTMLQPVAYETENILRVQDVQKTKELVAAGTPPHLILLPSQMSPQEAAEFYDFYHDLAGPLRPVIMLGWNPRILNRPSEHPFVQYLLSRDANYAAYEEVFDYSPYFTTNALIHFKRERKNIEQLLATRFPEFARTEMRESQNLGSHRNEARVTDTDGIIVELRKAMASPDDTLQKLIVLGRELEARTGLLAGDALIQVIFEGSRISLPLRLPEVLRFICDFLGSDEPVIESFNRHGVIAFVWLAMNVETGMEFGGLKGVAEGEKWLRDAFDLEAAARLLKSDPVRFADFLGILSTDSAERARSRYPDIVRPSLAGEQTVEQRIEHLVQSASRRSQIFLEKTQSGSPDENEKPWIGKIASLEAEELRGVIRWMAGDRTAVDYLQRLEISYSGFPLNFLAAMTIAVQWAPDSIEWENYCAISRLSPLDLYRGFSFLQVLLDQGIAKDRHSSSVMGRLFRKFKERQEMREKKHIWGPDRISNDSLPILNQNGNSMIPRAENRRNQISSERIRRAFSDDAYDDLSLIGHRLDVAFGSEEVRGYSTAEIEQIQNEMGPLIGNGTIGIPQLMLLYENRHIRLSTYRNLLLEVVWTAFSTALERAAATGDWDEFQTLCARFITSGPTARDVLMELERMLVDYRYGNGTVIAIDATTRRAQLDPWWRHIANFPGEAESVLATLRTPHFQSLFQNPKQGIWYSQIHRFIHRLWNHRPDTSEATVQEINQMTRERIGMVAGENDDEDENPGGVSEGYLQAMLMARQIAAALFDLVDALTQPSQEEPDLPGRLAANEVRISHDMIYNLLQAHHPDDGLPADSSDVLSDLSYYMLLQGLIVSGLRHHDINFLMRLIEAGSENVHLLILESIAARYSRSALMQEAPSMGAAIHDLLNYDESYSLILRKLQNFYPESDWSHPIDDNIIERLSRPEMRASHLTTQATAEARRVVVARKHPVSAFKKIGGRQELRLASYDAIRSVIGGPRSRAAKEAVARTIVRRGASGMASDLRVLSRRIQVAQQRVIDLQADQHLRAISHIETPTVVEYQISDAEWEELEKNRRVLKELMKTVRDAAASNKFVISRFNVSQQIVPKLAQIFKSLDHHKSQQIDYRPFDEAFVVFNAGLPDEGALENAAAVTVTSNKLASIQGVALASDGYMQGIGRPSGARLYTAALILAAEALSWKTIDSLAQYETGKFRPWSEEALNRLTVAVQGMLDRQRAELRLAQAA